MNLLGLWLKVRAWHRGYYHLIKDDIKLESHMTTPCRTPLYYAFFGTQDNEVEETAPFVNLIHLGSWGDWVTAQGRADLMNTIMGFGRQAKLAGKHIMPTCDWCLYTQTNPRHLLNRDLSVGYMIEFCDRLRAEGLMDIVAAWYPIDEPNIGEISLSPQQIFDANAVVRDVTQHYTQGIKPLAVIYGASGGHYPGIEGYDWCGFDNYGSDIFNNGEYNHLTSQLNVNQKTILVPGGGDPWRENPAPFYEHAQTDPRVIMIMPFKWFGGDGIRSNGMAPQYHQVGEAIVETNPFPIAAEPEPEPEPEPMPQPYVLTASDIQLLSNLAGALNTGRALVPPAERFGNIGIPAIASAPSVKWSHADELEELVKRATGGGNGPTPPPIGDVFEFEMPWKGYPSRWKFPANPADPDPPQFMNQQFMGNSVIVAKLVIPADAGTSVDQGYTSIFEAGGEPHLRVITVSLTKNDFRPVDPTGQNGPFTVTQGKQASIFWGTGQGQLLQPGQTYYFNCKNVDGVPGQAYPAMIETNWPHY